MAAEAGGSLRSLLEAAASAQSVGLSADGERALESYLQILLRWRERLNLVAQRSIGEIIGKHVEDSFSVVSIARERWRAADLGSGGGFPGIVLAIMRPDVRVELVESRQRKVAFLRAAVRQIGLTNAVVREARAEDLAADADLRRSLDMVVSRAVWSLAEFLERAAPLLRPGGVAVAMRVPGEAETGGSSLYGAVETRTYSLRAGEARLLIIAQRRE